MTPTDTGTRVTAPTQEHAALELADLLTTHPQLDGNVFCPVYSSGNVGIQITAGIAIEKRDALFADLLRIFDATPEVVLSSSGSGAWRSFCAFSNDVRFEVTAHYGEAEAALLHEQARSKQADTPDPS
jgi:hypothetical protein